MIVAVDKPGEPSFPLLKIYIDVIAGVMSSIHYPFFFHYFSTGAKQSSSRRSVNQGSSQRVRAVGRRCCVLFDFICGFT